MNDANRIRWSLAVLDEMIEALARSDEARQCLVLKGARVLSLRLAEVSRQSLDIDSNLREEFVSRFPQADQQREYLERVLHRAFREHFERAGPVRYSMVKIRVRPQPPKGHPRGWSAFAVELKVTDNRNPNVGGLPPLKLDIAAPEPLSEYSAAPLNVGGGVILAYTTERTTAEKLRAFLQSLPAYRSKMRRLGDTVRTKDIYNDPLSAGGEPHFVRRGVELAGAGGLVSRATLYIPAPVSAVPLTMKTGDASAVRLVPQTAGASAVPP